MAPSLCDQSLIMYSETLVLFVIPTIRDYRF